MEQEYFDLDDLTTEELILFFRNRYNEVYVSGMDNGDEYIWRTLTQKEYREITEFAVNQMDAYERICQTAVLYPELDFINKGLGYLPESLAPDILNESGYGEIRKEQFLLKTFRSQIENSFEQQAELLINYAFPYITFEVMENWTKEKLIKYVARAEWNLSKIQQKDHLVLMTESEREAMLKEAEDEIEQEQEKQEPFNIMKLANSLRRRGQDPMFVLRHLYKKEKDPFFEPPFIGGVDQTDTMLAGIEAWKQKELPSNGRYDTISKQVQAVSNKRRRHVPRSEGQ